MGKFPSEISRDLGKICAIFGDLGGFYSRQSCARFRPEYSMPFLVLPRFLASCERPLVAKRTSASSMYPGATEMLATQGNQKWFTYNVWCPKNQNVNNQIFKNPIYEPALMTSDPKVPHRRKCCYLLGTVLKSFENLWKPWRGLVLENGLHVVYPVR